MIFSVFSNRMGMVKGFFDEEISWIEKLVPILSGDYLDAQTKVWVANLSDPGFKLLAVFFLTFGTNVIIILMILFIVVLMGFTALATPFILAVTVFVDLVGVPSASSVPVCPPSLGEWCTVSIPSINAY